MVDTSEDGDSEVEGTRVAVGWTWVDRRVVELGVVDSTVVSGIELVDSLVISGTLVEFTMVVSGTLVDSGVVSEVGSVVDLNDEVRGEVMGDEVVNTGVVDSQ